jgi:hypothetical protein
MQYQTWYVIGMVVIWLLIEQVPRFRERLPASAWKRFGLQLVVVVLTVLVADGFTSK